MMALIAVFTSAFFLPDMMNVGYTMVLLLLTILIVDITLLYNVKNGIDATRTVTEKLSNGDENEVAIDIKSRYSFSVDAELVDEIPYQFEIRNFSIQKTLPPYANLSAKYLLRPTIRGLYNFGKIHVFVKSKIGLIQRRYSFDRDQDVKVYPSYIHMKKTEFSAVTNKFVDIGTTKIRRIGHTLEFEKIKDYVIGDDLRTLNWKATAKANKLMVNQYQEERSQTFYTIIDIGRVMKMPFNDLSLLDYSINATLALNNIILKRNDLAGLICFSNKIASITQASKGLKHLQKINDQLYNVQTDFKETDFQRLFITLKRIVTHRCNLIIFTNFETLNGLERQMLAIRSIAKYHKVIIVIFQNSTLNNLLDEPALTNIDVMDKTVAEKLFYEKKLIISALNSYGIATIFTEPEHLTSSVIQSYLNLKRMTY